ncbi:putative radical SAM protein YgiQ [Mesotoga prima MesG1.Ag.4.2]|uniref:Putative radical SAM protein YgiQ n=1 Tax=Mesotoga prima MesG1.Ag.4.2 TaxID=660470 RepID=I2F2X9_9BACT|nr:YgiQ family radical SAM protein [Mesotoga prima]AFK06282.1 putative radical SAM protein YgiQ [Mesotoga prima MesG1.Ag.4.2]
MNIPMTRSDMVERGREYLDVILITGDAFVDHPSFGTAMIARVLESHGWKVGVISQPDWRTNEDISVLGKPALFFGVTSGNVDSMVANYTSTGKKRRSDDYTPGGFGGKRPDRATIVYSNLIRQVFKETLIILGGIEASLRRFSHFDWWSNRIRKSILLDSKADLLVYGMGEKPILEIADKISKKREVPTDVEGTVFWSSSKPAGIELPSHEEVSQDKRKYFEMTKVMHEETDPVRGRQLFQLQDNRYVVQNKPPKVASEELDAYYSLPFTRRVHPVSLSRGRVKALETVRYSVTSHRGCYGQCNFCAIAFHQGRTVVSRSEDSIIQEISAFTRDVGFRGTVTDVGGPTANMYGYECSIKEKVGACAKKRCLFPEVCSSLKLDHSRYLNLLKRIRKIPGVKHVFVSSGIRYDLILKDKRSGRDFLRELLQKNVSGQLKIAPEHTAQKVLEYMGKPSKDVLLDFLKEVRLVSSGKCHIIGYFIAAHPGCTKEDMMELKRFVKREMHYNPEQVQLFTPTPGTISTAMYFTEMASENGDPVFIERSTGGRNRQKEILVRKEILDRKPDKNVEGTGNKRNKRDRH